MTSDIPLPDVDDERRIQRAHYEYARALDERDWAALDHIFADNCVARYGDDAPLCGRAAIVAGVRRYLDGCGPTQHMIGNITVALEEDGLTSRAAVRAAHRARDDDRIFWSIAHYSSQWIATPRGWRARIWRMDVDFNHGDPTVLSPRD
ncbi:nuclear transport factor 2 family protein [Sphingobium aromaticivastans]|uniref:nuclear transport factor 2 family protein n=1 Tax=Sphingobium aromaticivastans TaxID=1778665 RepID=UPI0030197BC1